MPLISKKSISKFKKSEVEKEIFDHVEELSKLLTDQITNEINKRIIERLIKENKKSYDGKLFYLDFPIIM